MGLLSSVSFLLYVFAWATPCFSGATAEVCKSCRMAGYKAVGSRSTRPTEGKARSVSNDPIGRALGSLTTSDYDIKFTEENKRILESYHLLNKRMVRDTSVNPTSETLEWTQVSRCFWSCEEEYLLVDYYQDGDKSNPVMKVFVAKSELSPPSEFRTSGYEGYLHFGFLYFGDQNQAVFFVLHPNNWGPYQHRFKTNDFTAFFNDGIGEILASGASAAAGAAVAAAAGAAMGSIVPVAGTIIGGLAGASVGLLSDDYFGDYLRYIG